MHFRKGRLVRVWQCACDGIGTAEATLSDRDEPTLINHLMDVTAAFGLAIHEDWEYGFFQPLIALTQFFVCADLNVWKYVSF